MVSSKDFARHFVRHVPNIFRARKEGGMPGYPALSWDSLPSLACQADAAIAVKIT